MAAPNIVNVANIYGRTNVANVTETSTAIVSNPSGSGKVFKINSLIISNFDGANTALINAAIVKSSDSYYVARTIEVPYDATLLVITKDTGIYLAEDETINLSSNVANHLQGICSYEEISE